MIKNKEHAIRVQTKRLNSGKRDVSKAVRRWFVRFYGEPYTMAGGSRCGLFEKLTPVFEK